MTKNAKTLLDRATIWLLILSLLFLLVVAFQVTSARAWDGIPAMGFAYGSGTESNPFLIRTEGQMGYFLQQVINGVTYENQYIRLESDLDMTGTVWANPGAFSGDFDGNFHTIRMDCPLFSQITQTGHIQKLRCFGDAVLTGPIFGKTNSGVIEYCMFSGTVYNTESSYGGLIVRENLKDSVIRGCSAVGSVTTAYGGDDFSSFTGMVASNTGTIDTCWSALTLSGNCSGKYSEAFLDPFSAHIYVSGTVTNVWYDSVRFPKVSRYGTGLTTQNMQSEAFLTSLNAAMPAGMQWALDTNGVNSGYPVLERCLAAEASVAGSNGTVILYHTEDYALALQQAGEPGTIYYTLDGTNPVDSDTRQAYQSGEAITISGDVTVSMVVEADGVYSAVKKQDLVQMLGAGTAEDPYQIFTKRQLDQVRLAPEANYLLCADLTYTDEDYQVDGAAPGGWKRIETFSGVLDGSGHAIIGLRGGSGGLIYTLSASGVVKNLQLVDHLLYNANSTKFGPIATYSGGLIDYCYVRSAFTMDNIPKQSFYGYNSEYGGIVANGGTVRYCVCEGLVLVRGGDEGDQVHGGGIAGSYANVVSSVFRGTLYLNGGYRPDWFEVGGISGSIHSSLGTTTDCFASCVIQCSSSHSYRNYIAATSPTKVTNCVSSVSYIERSGYSADSYSISRLGYTFSDTPMGYLESSYPDLDFDSKWVMTAEGPLPVGANYGGYTLSADTEDSYRPADCENTGSAVVRDGSGAVLDTPTFPALGHNWGEWQEITAPQPGVAGEEQRVCTRDSGHVETRSIDALPLPLTVTVHPADFTGAVNAVAVFRVEAEGEGLTYQWQVSDDGENWTNSSVKNPIYSTKLTASRDGRMVRCIVSDQYGSSLTTDAATMKVSKLAITTQPQDFLGKVNSVAKFTVEALGEGLTYQWQTSVDGVKWSNSSVKNPSYSTKLTAAKDGRMVRCVVRDQYGNSITSRAAVMNVYQFSIVTQPQNYVGAVNSSAKFTVIAQGDSLAYQWQYSDNGTKWANSSVKSAVYTTKLTEARDGRMVRCIITDCYGGKLTTTPVRMTIG